MTEKKQLAFISLDRGLDDVRKKNLHLTVGLLSFIWMVFHFAIVFFFIWKLESIVMVGVFLGLGNLFAFLLDIPIGILQYHLKPKTLYLMGAISQTIALFIFANFIFQVTDFITLGLAENSGILQSTLRFFLYDGLNMLLLTLACFCYGFTKEINEITTISYVLNNADPSQYKRIIAVNNLFYGIGGFFGLLVSGVILSLSPKLIIIALFFMVFIIIFIALKLFDNSVYTLKFSDLERFKVFLNKGGILKVKDNIKTTVAKVNLKQALGQTKYVFLRPIIIKKEMITLDEMITETKESFIDIYVTLKHANNANIIVYWAFSMVLVFGFWDTFATTFLIDFLDKVSIGYSYILLGIIAIPAFGLQEFFSKLADKVGVYSLANLGLLISGGSLIFMSFFSRDVGNLNVFIIVGLGLLNSVGYAICMSLSVATFLETYNKSFAEHKELVEIDSNASAAPVKILQNLANVVGLVLGGLILNIFGYAGFLFIFLSMIIGLFVWSVIKKKKITGTDYDSEE